MKKNDSSKAWDREYRNPDFLSKDSKPQADFLRFLKWVKKKKILDLASVRALDIGCGNGRNAHYLAEKYGARVTAFDFSREAIRVAKENFSHANINFEVRDMAKSLPAEDCSIDLVLDIMSSHSLSENEAEGFIRELHRVMRPGGLVYIKTLAKEGDKNASRLIKDHPGSSLHSYIHPTLGSEERVWSETGLHTFYEPFFEILFLERKSGYQRFGNQSYKRNYWSAYMRRL